MGRERVRIGRYLQDRPLQAPGLPYTLPAGEPCFASHNTAMLGSNQYLGTSVEKLSRFSTVRAGAADCQPWALLLESKQPNEPRNRDSTQ